MEVGSFGRGATWVGAESAAPGAGSLAAIRRSGAQNDYPYLDDNGTRWNTDDDRTVRRQNADFDVTDVWAIGRYEPDERGTRLTLLMNAYDREQGIGGLALVPTLHARARTQRLLAGISSRMPCQELSEGCRLELGSSLVSTRALISDPFGEIELRSPWVASAGDRFVQHVRFTALDTDGLRVLVVGSEEAERLQMSRGGGRSLDARRSMLRGAASVRKELGHGIALSALLGTFREASASDSGNAAAILVFDGRLGADVELGQHVTLLANVGRYVRTPTLGELFGISPSVRGNDELVPERALGADVGARGVWFGSGYELWFDVTAFARETAELIAYRRTSRGFVTPFNVASARVMGAELAAGADLFRAVRSETSLTVLDPRDVTPGRALQSDLVPFLSQLVVSERLELYRERPIPSSPLSRAGIALVSHYRSERVADPAGLIVLPSQLSFDVEGHVLIEEDRAAFRAAVENLLDGPHQDYLGYPLPGRSVHVGIELWFF
jgi:iron complex outermembrane receptor protein